MPIIEAPDGKIIEFPDTMPEVEINRAMAMQYPPSQQPTAAPDEAPGQNILSRLNESLVKRGVNIAGNLEPKPGEGFLQTLGAAPGRSLRMTGQAAGFGNDVIGEGVRAGFNALPDFPAVKGMANDLYQSTFLPGALQAGMQGYGRAREMFPEGMENVEAIGNIIGLGTMGAGGRAVMPAVREGGNIVRDVAAVVTRKTPAILEKQMDMAIEQGIKKGIRPTVVGKSDAGAVSRHLDRAKMAVKDIIKFNFDNLPQDLEGFSSAISKTKKDIYREYSGMSGAAGQEGALVDLSRARSELQSIIDRPNTRQSIKNAAAKALDEIKSYNGQVSPDVAEDLIATFNNDAKAFWKNPNIHDVHFSAMAERTAQSIRKATDTAISEFQGPGYQELKNRYGALSSIEKEVTDRATVDARKNFKGFFDLADIASTGEFVLGLTRLDPTAMAAAAAMKGTKNWFKHLNDPNRIVRGMFEDVAKLTKGNAPLRSNTMQMAQEMARQRQGARPSYGPQDLSVNDTGILTVAPPGLDISTPAYLRNRPALPPGQGFEFGSGYLPSTITDTNFMKPATNLESLAQDFLSSQRQGGLGERLTANAKNVMNVRDAQILDNFDRMISDFVKRGKGRGIGNQP